MRALLAVGLALAVTAAHAQTELSNRRFAVAGAVAATYSAAVRERADGGGRESLRATIASVEASSRRFGGALSYVAPAGGGPYSEADPTVALTGFVYFGPGRGGADVTALSLTGQRSFTTNSTNIWVVSPALSLSRRVVRTALLDVAPQVTVGGNVVFVEGSSEGLASVGGSVEGGVAIAFDSLELRTVLTPTVGYTGVSGAETGAVFVGFRFSLMSHYTQ